MPNGFLDDLSDQIVYSAVPERSLSQLTLSCLKLSWQTVERSISFTKRIEKKILIQLLPLEYRLTCK
jgi:hypothetical protein